MPIDWPEDEFNKLVRRVKAYRQPEVYIPNYVKAYDNTLAIKKEQKVIEYVDEDII